MASHLYSYGKPFSQIVCKVMNSVRDRIEMKKAAIVVIDGGLGSGKTTLAIHLAEEYQGTPINLEHQYAFGGDQFIEKLNICNELGYKVVIYDEAGDFSRRNALSEFNRKINMVFDTFRVFSIMVIVVLPIFSVLDKHLFDLQVPRLLFNCHARKKYQGNFRAYSLDKMNHLRFKMRDRKFISENIAYSLVTPNFRGHFLDLTPEKSKELEGITLEGKTGILTDNILKSKGLVSKEFFMKRLGKTKQTVERYMREEGVKPEVIYKNKAYYHKELLEFLSEKVQYDTKKRGKAGRPRTRPLPIPKVIQEPIQQQEQSEEFKDEFD